MNDGAFDPMGVGPRGDPGAAIGVQSWERTYATVLHLTGLLTATGMPIVAALIMWLVKRDESTYIDDHGKEAMNFQISMLIYIAAGFVCPPVSVLLWTAACLLGLVGTIMAAIAANHGRYYRYPATLRLIK